MLGRITGKTTTKEFTFLVEKEVKKFQYVQIEHQGKNILSQIIELERYADRTVAYCQIIGYRDKNTFQRILYPFKPDSEVFSADDNTITDVLGLDKEGAYIGVLNGYEQIKVYIDLKKLLTHKVAVLARTGSGKSYSVGVLVEEILDRDIPLLIIDPHGEYNSLHKPNEKDGDKLKIFGLEAKGYPKIIQEYSPDIEINPEARQLKLSQATLESGEILHLLPAKLSQIQQGMLYHALKDLENPNFETLISELEFQENQAKYGLIHSIEYLQKLDLFSDAPTPLTELIRPGKCSVINLRGVDPDLQEVIVYKLLRDLFDARKKGNVPPFFVVVEECQNFCPERNFKEAKSSSIIRQLAVESRKFGIGMAVVSQRSSRVDKSLLSQCSTQIILKISNPHDLKAISNSVEGITLETEKEIRNLPIGVALVTGIVDLPVFVDIRPRKSKHGGDAVEVIQNVVIETEGDESKEIMSVISQNYSLEDVKKLSPGKNVNESLIPCGYFSCDGVNLLVNLNTGEFVENKETGRGKPLMPKIELSPQQKKIFDLVLQLKEFKASNLFGKSALQFSELHDILQIFLQKGYVQENEGRYTLSGQYNLNPKEYAFYGRPEYIRAKHNQLETNYNLSDMQKAIERYVKVKNVHECYLMVFNVLD
jgi:uncharacterized protein